MHKIKKKSLIKNEKSNKAVQGEVTKQVKAVATKCYKSLILEPQKPHGGRPGSCKLSSDLHMCAVVGLCLCAHTCLHTHAH